MFFRHVIVSFYPYFVGHDTTHFMLITIAVITILINENMGEHASHFGGDKP